MIVILNAKRYKRAGIKRIKRGVGKPLKITNPDAVA